ncbi:hypothetical protein TNCV_4636071 [Trichonephila clavipes]|nr:hypothetical protein TNCV_4636071 [Trichonephila clavipes]
MSVLEALEKLPRSLPSSGMYNPRHYEMTLQQGFRYRVLLAPSQFRIIGNEQADSAAVGDDASAASCSAIGYEARHHASYFLRSGRNHGVRSWITNCTL